MAARWYRRLLALLAVGATLLLARAFARARDGERFTNIAAPLPGANLSTVLRLSAIDGTEDGDGIRLIVIAVTVYRFDRPLSGGRYRNDLQQSL